MTSNKYTICFLVLISFTISLSTFGQSQMTSRYALAEKIYLQTDGLVYTSDQTIWFKGTVVHGSDHKPTQLSGILYVDLIDGNEQIIFSKRLKIGNGVTSGAMQLNPSMPPGKYLLRAYTNWNLNFDDLFNFEQYIDIYPPSEENSYRKAITNITIEPSASGSILKGEVKTNLLDSLHKGRMKLIVEMPDAKDSFLVRSADKLSFAFEVPINTNSDLVGLKAISSNGYMTFENMIIDRTKVDLQFFPEGGNLIEGVVTKIGFKAVDIAGFGKKVMGEVYTSQGQLVQEFESNELGMGYFLLEPKANDNYVAKVGDREFPLPKVENEGVSLSIKKSENRIIVDVLAPKKYKALSLDVISTGVIQRQINGVPDQGRLRIVLEAKEFIEGILRFKLKDGDNPVASRSFFNFRSDLYPEFELASTSPVFKQRELGGINIQLLDTGEMAENTSASVLIINKDQLGQIQSSRNNILTQLLLNAEIKGEIESPNIYFDEANDDAWEDMEALMLTQGWSRYNYIKTEEFEFADLEFKPEIGILVTGKVTSDKKGKRSKGNIGLTLATFGQGSNVLTQTTDEKGNFAFQIPDEFGEEMNVLIQTIKKGNQRTFNIELDEHAKPKIGFDQMVNLSAPTEVVNELVSKHQERKLIEDAWRVETRVTDLGEVIVEDYELTPEREEVMERFGAPSVVLEGDELRESEGETKIGLFSLLQRKYPDVINIFPVSIYEEEPELGISVFIESFLRAQVHGDDLTMIVVDGIPILPEQYKVIQYMPVSEVKSFEIISQPDDLVETFREVFGTPPPAFIINYSFISIYTYAGKGFLGTRKAPGLFQGTVPVFSIEEEFYAPKYEKLSRQDWVKPDRRSLVHWEPKVKFDESGKAEVDFYNADNLGEMLVVLELLYPDGRIAYSTTTFKVEEQTNR